MKKYIVCSVSFKSRLINYTGYSFLVEPPVTDLYSLTLRSEEEATQTSNALETTETDLTAQLGIFLCLIQFPLAKMTAFYLQRNKRNKLKLK